MEKKAVDVDQALASWLLSCRVGQGLRQREMALKLFNDEMCSGMISRLERGEWNFTVPVLKAIASSLEIAPRSILNGAGICIDWGEEFPANEKTFSEFMLDRMKEMGVNIVELTRLSGVSRSVIYRLLVKPTPRTLVSTIVHIDTALVAHGQLFHLFYDQAPVFVVAPNHPRGGNNYFPA